MISFVSALQIFGTVTPPPGVIEFNTQAGGPDSIGIVIFVSNLIKVIAIVAGIFGLFNIISAGYILLNSGGNPKETEKAMLSLNYSLLGLIIIVASFTLTSLASYLVFGDASFILNPRLPTAIP
jgi:hypothetical protein